VAGRPIHCPPQNPNISSLLTEEQAGPKLATDVLLNSPQHIAFAPNGDLYIIESDGKFTNQIRVVNTDGTIAFYAGDKSKCNCQEKECKCFNPKEELATKMLLNNPTAITVTPDNVLHVADMGNLRIHSIVATLPGPHRYGQYEVLYPQTQESYLFNRYGQHIATKNIITDQYIYNFTYNVNSYYGKLVKVTDSNNNNLVISRDYTTQAKEIVAPGGNKCKLTMDNMGQLYRFVTGDNTTTTFTYFSNTGLLETKETSDGWSFFYEYDENGRLASIVQPTGEVTAIGTDISPEGALVVLDTQNVHLATMATNGHTLALLHGKLLSLSSLRILSNSVNTLLWLYCDSPPFVASLLLFCPFCRPLLVRTIPHSIP
jgi:YD repeat-containing protein